MNDRSIPFFLLGAGFGADAGEIVGPIDAESIYIGKYRFSCAYPLVRDLPRICFPDPAPPVGVGDVELRLAESVAAGDLLPIKRLCDELAKADHYLAPRLVGWPDSPNPYMKFFADFPSSSFATYNYDAFVEFALFRAGRWSPHDGYGVKVATSVGFTASPYQMRDSKCLVLHLHGTYMVYTYDHAFGSPDEGGIRWIEFLDAPRFAFDPHSLGGGFYPCERFMAGLAYDPTVDGRIIAPIPDKSAGLAGAFVQSVAKKAEEIIAQCGQVVAIGYAFSPQDQVSYSTLLDTLNAASHPRAVIVSPEANRIVERLRPEYQKVEWVPVNLGFAEWVDAGYPGVA